jgi:cytochrome c5
MKCRQILATVLFFIFTQPIFSASHHPQEFLKQISGSKDEGEQIVQHFCINCHAQKPLIPLGAPRIGVTADWAPRLKQQMAVLFKHTSEGINAMPARGGCFECSDEQLILSIIAMLPEPLQADFSRQYRPQKNH